MDLLADIRYALRVLARTPVFAVAAIGTLALGIGANTTIFSLVQSVLLQPLPYANPDQLVMVWEDASGIGFPKNTPAPGNYNEWKAANRSFSDMAATRGNAASLTGDGAPEQVIGRAVTANFFNVLGVRPLMGRTFAPGEDTSGAPVVVISHALWQRRYHGDPRIVGRTMVMNDAKYEVIGVAPRPFVFRDRVIDYWIPMRLPPQQVDTLRDHFLNVVGRLKPGISIRAADEEIKAIAARMTEQHSETNRQLGATVVALREEVLGDTRVELIALMTAAMAIVLIACANLVSLLLARSAGRRGEYAVRLSLGATRTRLARQVIVEALCLSIAGGALGSLMPVLTATLLERLVPAGLQAPVVSIIDWPLLLFAALLSVATGLVFSVGPALLSARSSAAQALQQHARGSIGGAAGRLRDGLVVAQVAATLVLLVAAGLMLRTLAKLDAVHLGFRADHVLTMQVALPQPKYADVQKRMTFYDRVLRDIRVLPGVERAAFGSMLPFQSIGNTRWFGIEGRLDIPGEANRDTLFRVGTSDYLRTLGVTPIAGRLLDERDAADAPRAVVINETMAKRYLPNQSAVGHRLRFGPDEPWFTIVGVVKDVLERGYEQEDKPATYVSLAQQPGGAPNLVVRVAGDPLASAVAVQRLIQTADPDQPVRLVRAMDDIIGLTVSDRRQHTALLVAFGGLALLIASLGIYGLLAQSVAARSREIGLRMALGATWRNVVTMVMARGLALSTFGVILGAGIARLVTRAMQTLLYEVSAGDTQTYIAVLGLFATVAIAACAVPSLRAARVDPMEVLREQ
jgi:putative ABC transport system permease protein